MLLLLSLVLLVLTAGGQGDDTVAATVGRHTMGRIAELLADPECRQLQVELESPEEEELGMLEPEHPPEEPEHPPEEPEHPPEEPQPSRRRRSRGSRSRSPGGCSEALRFWLLTAGEATTWDRLVRALQQIGRADIARELGKNLNQDRSLQLRRNVEGYRGSVQHLSSVQLQPGGERARRAPQAGDLLFERHPPPRYGRGLLGWVRPVVLGILGAFLSSALLTVSAMYFCHWRRLLGA